MVRFDYVAPKSLAEASVLLRDNPGAKVLAGGAAMVILMRNRIIQPELVVDIKGVGGLDDLQYVPGEGLQIGALVTHRTVELHPTVRQHCPALAELEHHVASVQVRNKATLGGNLCHAEPASDPPTLLLALDARVHVTSVDGDRQLPLGDFIRGYYDTALGPGELLTRIVVPEVPERTGAAYIKYSTRTAMDMCLLGSAAVITLDGAGHCQQARVAIGNAHHRPVRMSRVEEALQGERLTEEVIAKVSALAREGLDPVSDVRGSAEYRLAMAPVMTARAIRAAAGRAAGAVSAA